MYLLFYGDEEYNVKASKGVKNICYRHIFISQLFIRKDYQMKLLESLKKIKNVFDAAYNGILIIDECGTIVFHNKAAGKVLNTDSESIIEGTTPGGKGISIAQATIYEDYLSASSGVMILLNFLVGTCIRFFQ